MSVINVGSINIDHCYRVSHLVQPGETVTSQAYEQHLGGKGLNQSVALHRAGASVCHVGAIGHDTPALRQQLEVLGLDTEFIANSCEATGHAMIQIDDQAENCIVLHAGANHSLSLDRLDAALAARPETRWLLLQNETNEVEVCIRWAHEQGLRIAFNPAPATAELAQLPLGLLSLLVVNELELAMLSGFDEPEAALSALKARCPDTIIVATFGKGGSVCVAPRAQRYQVPANVVEAVDTTAAGDTFVGFLLASLLVSDDIEAALKLATQAAAVAVTRQGAVPAIPLSSELV